MVPFKEGVEFEDDLVGLGNSLFQHTQNDSEVFDVLRLSDAVVFRIGVDGWKNLRKEVVALVQEAY